MATDHEWGEKTTLAFDYRQGSGWTERIVYRNARICTRCGVSESAAGHFGWDCKEADDD